MAYQNVKCYLSYMSHKMQSNIPGFGDSFSSVLCLCWSFGVYLYHFFIHILQEQYKNICVVYLHIQLSIPNNLCISIYITIYRGKGGGVVVGGRICACSVFTAALRHK